MLAFEWNPNLDVNVTDNFGNSYLHLIFLPYFKTPYRIRMSKEFDLVTCLCFR